MLSLAGPVAQLAEQQTLNLLVEGSIPSGLTINPNNANHFSISLLLDHVDESETMALDFPVPPR